jgi:hypothetical protein
MVTSFCFDNLTVAHNISDLIIIGSLIKALTTLYPEHQVKPWLFRRVPQGYWNDPQNQLLFMDWFASVYNIKSVEDWYNVDVKQIIKNGGVGLIEKHNHSLINALKSVCNINTERFIDVL